MKKKLLLGTGFIAIVAASFFTGSALAAGNHFITQLTTDAELKIVGHANQTTQNLVDNINDDVQAKIQDKLDAKVETKNQIVDTQLQDYYNKKIDDLVNGDNTAISQPIDATATNVVVNDQKKIDKAFDELFTK